MKSKMLLLFFILFLSVEVFGEEKTEYKHVFIRTSTEWMSFSTGYGTYGYSLNFSAFTLRWRNVFWEILKLHASRDFSYPRTNDSDNINCDDSLGCNEIDVASEYSVVSYKVKSLAGIPFFITADNRHEIRVGAGVGIGVSCYKKDGYILDISTELSYIIHIFDSFSVQVGMSADFPLFTDDEMFSSAFGSYYYKSVYMPNIYGFAGLRF